jgi:hypothetical protein
MRSAALYGFGRNSESPRGLPNPDVRTTRISGRHVAAIPASPSPPISGIRISVNKTEISELRTVRRLTSASVKGFGRRPIATVGAGTRARDRGRRRRQFLRSGSGPTRMRRPGKPIRGSRRMPNLPQKGNSVHRPLPVVVILEADFLVNGRATAHQLHGALVPPPKQYRRVVRLGSRRRERHVPLSVSHTHRRAKEFLIV